VKGFTEALMGEMRQLAPHVKVGVVMPGHIKTNIAMTANQEIVDGKWVYKEPCAPRATLL
jgi:short-subunit dehydrogenase